MDGIELQIESKTNGDILMDDYKEKREKYLNEHPWEVLFGAFRALGLLVISMGSTYMAVYSAVEGKWDKGIFFLIAMVISDKVFDKMYELREKKIKGEE